MQAQFNSTCPCGCGQTIVQGNEIVQCDLGWVKWGHDKKPKICPRCQMALPATGVCDTCD